MVSLLRVAELMARGKLVWKLHVATYHTSAVQSSGIPHKARLEAKPEAACSDVAHNMISQHQMNRKGAVPTAGRNIDLHTISTI